MSENGYDPFHIFKTELEVVEYMRWCELYDLPEAPGDHPPHHRYRIYCNGSCVGYTSPEIVMKLIDEGTVVKIDRESYPVYILWHDVSDLLNVDFKRIVKQWHDENKPE